MSLTKEDLLAISDLIDVKLDNQNNILEKRFVEIDKRFDAVDSKFEEVDRRFNSVDKKFEEVDKRFDSVDSKFVDLKEEFKEMLIDNNALIAEHVRRVVSETVSASEERLSNQIEEIKLVTADNCYNIVKLKYKTS